jgi:HNH endonuclease
MADTTEISWSGFLFGQPLPKRCSECREMKDSSLFDADRSRPSGLAYICKDCRETASPGRPGQRERRTRLAIGQMWCRSCQDWLSVDLITKNGLCRSHEAAQARQRYAADPVYRWNRQAHAMFRTRGVLPVPLIGAECLLELTDGLCSYCPSAAETWDHVIPVSQGGKTEPYNIPPACKRCNSSKKDRDLCEWLDATGRELHVAIADLFATRMSL